MTSSSRLQAEIPGRASTMETETMGRVTVEATFENFGDIWNVQQGTLGIDQVRRVDVPDALVDTGATLISMPPRVILDLGWRLVTSIRVTS
jgi:hypothetical protein